MPPRKRDVKADDKAQAKTDKTTKKDIVTVQTSVNKQGVLVDHLVPNPGKYSVVDGADGQALSCYLMWSDVKDNHNKYYIAQGLQDQSGSYTLWTRYGRVGLDGVGGHQSCFSLDNLRATYAKKHREKTNKGYTVVKMALGKPNPSVGVELKKADNKEEEKNQPKSKLD